MACPNCNDTCYLCGNDALGDCTCVTAKNMRDLDEMYADAERELTEAHDQIDDLESQADMREEQLDTLKDAEANFVQRDAEVSEAVDALRAYLITQGHGGGPYLRISDTNLQRLVDVLGL